MREMELAALRRKRETAEKAGLKDRVDRIDAILAVVAGEPKRVVPEPVIFVHIDPMNPSAGMATPRDTTWAPDEPKEEQAEPVPAGVALTPAAQALADELGLTAEDFVDFPPSGKDGSLLVSDVKRIAEAKAHTQEDDTDGDD